MIEHDDLAQELYEAERTATPVSLLTDRHPDLSWEDARAVARATDEIRRAEGELQVGWKLGWTSEAMRAALGIDRPNWGTLWERQLAQDSIRTEALLHPKVEPELVWRCPQDLDGDVSAVDVRDAGGEWALGIEVVDPRFPSFDFRALDNTADNSSSAAVGVGKFRHLDLPVEDIEVEFATDGLTRRGLGSQAMGSPEEAVAWLVRSLAREGEILRAGQIVFSGGLTAPFDAQAGATYSISAEHLQGTSLRFT